MLHSSVISYQGSLHEWWRSWSLDNNVHFPTQGRHYRLCSQIIMSISTVATFWPESWLLVFKKWVVSLYTCPMVWCKWFGHSFSGSAVRWVGTFCGSNLVLIFSNQFDLFILLFQIFRHDFKTCRKKQSNQFEIIFALKLICEDSEVW